MLSLRFKLIKIQFTMRTTDEQILEQTLVENNIYSN